jgi:hypothetical protein
MRLNPGHSLPLDLIAALIELGLNAEEVEESLNEEIKNGETIT